MVNKPLHHGRIYLWFLLFQKLEFEVIVQPGHANIGHDRASRIKSSKEPISIDDDFPDAHLFRVEAVPNELVDMFNIYRK